MNHFYLLLVPNSEIWQLIDVTAVEKQAVWDQLSSTLSNPLAMCAASITRFYLKHKNIKVLSFESELTLAELRSLLTAEQTRMIALISENSNLVFLPTGFSHDIT